MVSRPLARLKSICCGILFASALCTGVACVTVDEGAALATLGRSPSQQIQLPDAEHMIDDLDRVMTAYGTISIKTPDVWGQDRLAKFRSEYEAQMAGWLKVGFKGDINASLRHSEFEATQVQVGANVVEPLPKGSTASTPVGAVDLGAMSRSSAALNTTTPAATGLPEKNPVALEPTVVLDEHSNYLNHLNQLRRINAGDDLTDRPGYGLYLVRIPVTLSPGPRSRRGKGAIITVSAKSVMTKQTLRAALRNAVINETVADLRQAIGSRSTHNSDQNPGRGIGSYSLLSFADTELFHGAQNIALLKNEAERQLASEFGDEPQHRSARIAEWLRGELQSSYHLLEQAATPLNTAESAARIDPLEELGDSILKRDFSRIAQVQPRKPSDSLVMQTSSKAARRDDGAIEERRQVLSILSFALRIQAAGVNRRLKQDIADQDPSLGPEVLRRISFFEPEPTDEAFHIFQKYVDSKWPLRVYAIEPVIAQQNVADAFGRRKLSSLDIVGSASTGPLRALTGFANQRQAADEETAIRLNPTMVGFGAGQSTFGWIFYPRLQTSGGKRLHLVTDVALLLSGRVPDPTGSDQSIEPGQRECTALVEMPNFIPKIEFITVANWFRTSEVGDGQKSDLEKGSTLGRRLVLAEEALKRSQVEGTYRPEEYQIASERLNQLKSLMPTQRMVVRVPYTDNENDARIFCSHGSQLRPEISGWHGKPPEEGDETTLFLEGKNFSIHDTHVIAGGKPALAVLVSRQLLQVTIPREACPTPSADGTSLLDIAVATPNGASNHLLIRMHSRDPRRGQHHDEKMEALLKEGAVALGNKVPPEPGTLPLHNPKNLGLGQAIAPGTSAERHPVFLVPAP
jgi:hypothetical protein